jgi:hypothetical protein
VLDLDKFGQSEPADDVGRFVGKLRLIVLTGASGDQGVIARADRLAERFVATYLQATPVSPVRVALWETLDLTNTLLQTWSRVRLRQVDPLLLLLQARADELRA